VIQTPENMRGKVLTERERERERGRESRLRQEWN
jgi:hypothetical protein